MPAVSLDPRSTEELLADPRCLGELPRVHKPTPEEFYRDYHKPRRPVIISGLIDDWRASQEWDFQWFKDNLGDVEVPVGLCFGSKRKMKLGEYIDRMDELGGGSGDGNEEHPPLYMEGWYFKETHKQAFEGWYEVPEHFADDWFYKRWFPFDVLPEPHGVLIGPTGAFTKLHYDLWASHSWNAHVRGRKQWLLVPPEHMGDVYIETRQVGGYFPGTDVAAPDLEQYPKLGDVRFYVGEASAGEVVWFPSLWLHEVVTLESAISITHNYLSPNIYFRVLGRYLAHRFLKKQGI